MNAYKRAEHILDAALNAPSALAKAQARKLLAYDTNTPGWWHEVDRLREYMDRKVGTTGGPMWETSLVPSVPQILAHKGFAADTPGTIVPTGAPLTPTAAAPSTGLSKYLTSQNIIVLALGLGAGALLFWYLTKKKAESK